MENLIVTTLFHGHPHFQHLQQKYINAKTPELMAYLNKGCKLANCCCFFSSLYLECHYILVKHQGQLSACSVSLPSGILLDFHTFN